MIEQILIISLFAYGWCTIFSENHILEGVGSWLEEKLPEYIFKPLVGCAICNSFWSGTLIHWFVFKGDNPVHWLLVCLCAVGLSAIIVNTINNLEKISEPSEE